MTAVKPSIVVLYQFLPPDDVVSAIHMGELSAGLAERGWDVTAYPCVWSCRNSALRFAAREQWRGVSMRRLWRPGFSPSSGIGRLLNAAWMIARWSWLAISIPAAPDILLIGSDPILSLVVALPWRLLQPRTKTAHWCFDLYPEAAVAEGLLSSNGLLVRLLKRLLASAYRQCALLGDIGPCMRSLLLRYPSGAVRETIVPWALEEPERPLPIAQSEREALFGDARLALLYSGNFGRAHSYEEILDLAGLIQPHGGKLVFSVRGNRLAELQQAAQKKDVEITFGAFADEDHLRDRLACADIHVVTLRPEWTGMVVPSKFFGAISAGRPVLFAGRPDASIAIWIRQFQIGWVLTTDNVSTTCHELLGYAASQKEREEMQQRCLSVYRSNFSRASQIDKWDGSLRAL